MIVRIALRRFFEERGIDNRQEIRGIEDCAEDNDDNRSRRFGVERTQQNVPFAL